MSTSLSDGVSISNSSTNSATLQCVGGYYVLDVHAGSWSGYVTVSKLAGDGSTWIDVLGSTNRLAADGAVALILPPCQCRITVSSATGVYAGLARAIIG